MRYLIGLLLVCALFVSQAQDPKFSRPDIPGEVMLDYGQNYWTFEPPGVDAKGWRSKSLSITYLKRKALNNKFAAYYGMGLTFEKIGFKPNQSSYMALTVDSLNVYSFQETRFETNRIELRKYKLATTFLDIPLEMRFHPKGTEEGEGFFVGFGVIGGIKLNAHDKLVYRFNDNNRKDKKQTSLNIASLRYGLQFRVGWKGIHFFYKKYYNEFFRDEILSYEFSEEEGANVQTGAFNPSLSTVGITLTGF